MSFLRPVLFICFVAFVSSLQEPNFQWHFNIPLSSKVSFDAPDGYLLVFLNPTDESKKSAERFDIRIPDPEPGDVVRASTYTGWPREVLKNIAISWHPIDDPTEVLVGSFPLYGKIPNYLPYLGFNSPARWKVALDSFNVTVISIREGSKVVAQDTFCSAKSPAILKFKETKSVEFTPC